MVLSPAYFLLFSIPSQHWRDRMTRTALGELEHLILLAILRVGANAYGAAVIGEIEDVTRRDVSHAAVYIALQRMEAKGLLTSRSARGTTERGGRAKSTFAVTAAGRARLRESASALFTMWEGLDPTLRGARVR
jgi:PadR family transcriptional regulator, regulatory protein PadR